jgi:hypothetical protein
MYLNSITVKEREEEKGMNCDNKATKIGVKKHAKGVKEVKILKCIYCLRNEGVFS